MHVRDKLDAALLRAIDRACESEMDWSEDNCAFWPAGVLKEVLGYDAAAEYRERVSTKRGAKRVLGRPGLIGAIRRASRRHGWKRIDPKSAQAGDIGFFPGSNSSVICRAPGWFVGRNERGVTVLPATCVRFAWKVARNQRVKRAERPLAMGPDIRRGAMVPTYAAPREPVSTAIGLTALLTSAGLSAGVAGAIGGGIVGVGLSIGLNYAASALLQRGQQPLSSIGTPNDPSIRYNERQAIPPKRTIYGTAQVGGALFFERTVNPYLYQGMLLCAKPIKRIRKIWIGTNELSFASLTDNAILTPLGVDGQPDYASNLLASIRLGGADQPIDPIIAAGFPAVQGTAIQSSFGTAIGSGVPGNAFDGDPSTVVAVTASGSLHAGKDFGSGVTKQLTGFRISGPQSTVLTDLLRVTVRGSNDGSTWTPIYVYAPVAYAAGTVLQDAFPATAAYRYLDVLLENTSSSSNNIWLREIEFFEPNGYEFRQRGIATAVLRYNFGADQDEYTALWGQTPRPNPIFLVDGIAVPDPRRSGCITQFDPSDDEAVAAAEATWTWSNNAALCQAHFLIQRYGGKIDPRKIDWDKVAAAADWDDSLIGTKAGGFIKRGTIDGLITLDQKPSDVMSSMLSANRGFVLESAGKVWVSSSKPRTPVATIHTKIISGLIEYQGAKPKRDMINRGKVRAVASGREYQTVDGPSINRADYQAIDGEVLDSVLELPFTLDNSGAFVIPQVLLKAFIETSRLGRRITVTCDVELLAVAADDLVGNTVNFSFDPLTKFNGVYFVEKWGFANGFGTIQLSLVEYDPAIETDFIAANDQQDFVLPPVDLAA
jgi:hypothetical protein